MSDITSLLISAETQAEKYPEASDWSALLSFFLGWLKEKTFMRLSFLFEDDYWKQKDTGNISEALWQGSVGFWSSDLYGDHIVSDHIVSSYLEAIIVISEPEAASWMGSGFCLQVHRDVRHPFHAVLLAGSIILGVVKSGLTHSLCYWGRYIRSELWPHHVLAVCNFYLL